MLISLFFWILVGLVQTIVTSFSVAMIYDKTAANLKKAFYVVLVNIVVMLMFAFVFGSVLGINGLLGTV